jgi:hypothetical protein
MLSEMACGCIQNALPGGVCITLGSSLQYVQLGPPLLRFLRDIPAERPYLSMQKHSCLHNVIG